VIGRLAGYLKLTGCHYLVGGVARLERLLLMGMSAGAKWGLEMTIKILLLMALVSAIAAGSYYRGTSELSEQENP